MLLSVDGLVTTYRSAAGPVRAVDGVSFGVAAGETVALVGESGCGKSTLGKTVTRLVEASEGRILFEGADITRLGGRALRGVRRRLQMIFQDPFGSLNPRQTIETVLTAPLALHGVAGRAERKRLARRMIAQVGLPDDALVRLPHEFSGGQRQRIGIARALILDPTLVVCDEPVSALDLSIQAQILNLLAGMKRERGLSYLFISHDLSVVRYFADRVLVMYGGRIVESGPVRAVTDAPLHPYARALMAAVPDPSKRRPAAPLQGDIPSPADLLSGCRFRGRCPLRTGICDRQDPALRERGEGVSVACHNV